jgi:pyruvate dehydrogenase (quinone)
MATAKIADIIVDTLASIGVKHVYGVPGNSLNGITDATRKGSRMGSHAQ